jgi:hypothetical protein
MSEAKGAPSPTAPVLAQIPAGAPGRAYWFGIGVLIWVVWFGGLEALSRWLRPRGSPPSPDEALALGGAAAILAVILLHPLLQVAVMRRLGAPAPLQRRGVHWLPVTGRPLPRRAAIAVLLVPQFTLLLLGVAAVLLGWSWGPFFAATAIAFFTSDRALAHRLHREQGCTQVDFRREGVVLYGTGRAFRPGSPVALWIGTLLMSAGWMLVALISGRELTEAVANAALELRSRREVIPYHPQPQWLTLTARHQIWIDGPRLRVEVTAVPLDARNSAGGPNRPAAEVRVPDPAGLETVSDGHALISGPDGTYLLHHGSRWVVRLSGGPVRVGGIPSVPAVDLAGLAGWRPGRVGAAWIGHYPAQIYERDGRIQGRLFSTRLWVTSGLPVPVRLEEKLPGEEREETLRSIRMELSLPDRLFRLPARAVIQDLHPGR